MAKFIPPSVEISAFNCPHCGVLTSQTWYDLNARGIGKDARPTIWTVANAEEIPTPESLEQGVQDSLRDSWRRMATGEVFGRGSESSRYTTLIANLHISKCYNCSMLSIWIYDRLTWPAEVSAPSPADDMPDDVRRDYLEAGMIASASPRGAAALLRLAIQKLCEALGGAGKNINEDIAALVKEGLDPRVQQALDVVRVVGNNAVHPGELDLRDDRATVDQLFTLTNLIVDIMITQPAHIARMYEALPAGALAAIGRRDKP